MGKFDGFLICSDFDGTFSGDENVISANKKAVEHFVREGGRFTFCTGRSVAYLKEKGLSDIVNAPACLVNGSVIYDYENEKVLFQKTLPFTLKEFAHFVSLGGLTKLSATIFLGYENEDVINIEIFDMPDEIADKKPLKIVCRFNTMEEADAFKTFAKENPAFKDCYISKSWSVGVELNPLSATKGTAIEFIKNYLGDIHTSVGIGDYENDIPLLLCADIGVCVANGLDAVKNIADRIVKRNDEGAVADLISTLTRL